MEQVKEKAYAKVNLGLDVTGRREDGYHLVSMVMQTIGICDDVAIYKTKDPNISLDIDYGGCIWQPLCRQETIISVRRQRG